MLYFRVISAIKAVILYIYILPGIILLITPRVLDNFWFRNKGRGYNYYSEDL
jgi:hypothetical protein